MTVYFWAIFSAHIFPVKLRKKYANNRLNRIGELYVYLGNYLVRHRENSGLHVKITAHQILINEKVGFRYLCCYPFWFYPSDMFSLVSPYALLSDKRTYAPNLVCQNNYWNHCVSVFVHCFSKYIYPSLMIPCCHKCKCFTIFSFYVYFIRGKMLQIRNGYFQRFISVNKRTGKRILAQNLSGR